ncbi:MAG: type II secretion system F family protein, partial [Anaerolineae bacterium]
QSEAQAAEQERIYSVGTTLTLEEVELSLPFRERVLRPMSESVLGFLGQLTPQHNIQEMQHMLEVAGRPYGWSVVDFMGLRVLSAMVCAVLAFVLTTLGDVPFMQRLLLMLAGGGLGFFLPVLWLRWRINDRKSQLLRALPDGLDMLNICVGAGLGFDAALSRVGEVWHTILADEFGRVVTEIRLGKTRREALLDLAARTEVMEIENFVATIVQADQLGVSIAKVLRTQAEQMRILRRQRAEEAARQATIKLLFPLVFLVFPSMLAVLLGPAVPQILETLGSL